MLHPPGVKPRLTCLRCAAEEEAEHAAARDGGNPKDPDALDTYLHAAAVEGKRESVVSDYMLHILGMNVSPSPGASRGFG